jgi:1-acyl-sn-glycerol-3-phosphate acyltransferase
MAFPEGMRSQDGKLMEFKGGIFSMAVKAGVPIVPISIANTHAVMPSTALFPFQTGAGKLNVHVHSPIDIEGKTEEEMASLVKEALLSAMPLDQHPNVANDMEIVELINNHDQVSSGTPVTKATENAEDKAEISQ